MLTEALLRGVLSRSETTKVLCAAALEKLPVSTGRFQDGDACFLHRGHDGKLVQASMGKSQDRDTNKSAMSDNEAVLVVNLRHFSQKTQESVLEVEE